MVTSVEQLNAGIAACTACPLHIERQGLPVVPDLTNIDVVGQDCVMIVFEQPTWKDEQVGTVGTAQYWYQFNNLIVNSGLHEVPLVITHRVRCRNPEGGILIPSLHNCASWMKEEIDLFNPSVVLLLGTLNGQEVYGKDYRVSRDRGQPRSVQSGHRFGGRIFLGTYHPNAVAQNPHELYDMVLGDYLLAKELFTDGHRVPSLQPTG